jgi:hypothetical protein
MKAIHRQAKALIVASALTLSPAPAQASDDLLDDMLDALAYVVSIVTGTALTAIDTVTPPTPMEMLRSVRGENRSEFWSMLEDAGYELKEMEAELAIIPGIEAKYILKRELTDGDREALERRLERHARDNRGLLARIQRSIIYGLLDASELGTYRIDQVKVQFLPLPGASFTVAPAEGPLSDEHDRIFRAVKEQQRGLRHVDQDMHERVKVQARPASTLKP